MNPLQTFYNNEPQRKAVEEFLVQVLKDLTIEKAFEGRDTAGIAEARTAIDTMFHRLSELYEPKKPIIINSSR
jgi:hypothetical protein